MIITQHHKLSKQLYENIIHIWQETGVTNPARADSFDTIQFSLANTGTLITAEIDTEVCGVVWTNHDYRRLYIHHMAVAVDRQNQGIGRRLLAEALKIAKATGYQAKLEVHQNNPAARHLYASMGFKDLDGYITMIKREL